MTTTNIRIEVPQDLYQFLAKVQAKSKEKGGKKISLAELLLNYALTGIHFANAEDADRLSPTDQIISVGSTSIALPNLISATQTTLSAPPVIFETEEDLKAERDAIYEKTNRLKEWEDSLSNRQIQNDNIAWEFSNRTLELLKNKDHHTKLIMENECLKPQIGQLKDELYRVREELKSEKQRNDELSNIKSRQKEMRMMLRKISDESFLSVVKDYGIGFLLVVAGIFMAIWNNKDKSKSEIIKTVFDENKEFFAKLNITDKEKFEQILQSMFSKKNK